MICHTKQISDIACIGAFQCRIVLYRIPINDRSTVFAQISLECQVAGTQLTNTIVCGLIISEFIATAIKVEVLGKCGFCVSVRTNEVYQFVVVIQVEIDTAFFLGYSFLIMRNEHFNFGLNILLHFKLEGHRSSGVHFHSFGCQLIYTGLAVGVKMQAVFQSLQTFQLQVELQIAVLAQLQAADGVAAVLVCANSLVILAFAVLTGQTLGNGLSLAVSINILQANQQVVILGRNDSQAEVQRAFINVVRGSGGITVSVVGGDFLLTDLVADGQLQTGFLDLHGLLGILGSLCGSLAHQVIKQHLVCTGVLHCFGIDAVGGSLQCSLGDLHSLLFGQAGQDVIGSFAVACLDLLLQCGQIAGGVHVTVLSNVVDLVQSLFNGAILDDLILGNFVALGIYVTVQLTVVRLIFGLFTLCDLALQQLVIFSINAIFADCNAQLTLHGSDFEKCSLFVFTELFGVKGVNRAGGSVFFFCVFLQRGRNFRHIGQRKLVVSGILVFLEILFLIVILDDSLFLDIIIRIDSFHTGLGIGDGLSHGLRHSLGGRVGKDLTGFGIGLGFNTHNHSEVFIFVGGRLRDGSGGTVSVIDNLGGFCCKCRDAHEAHQHAENQCHCNKLGQLFHFNRS